MISLKEIGALCGLSESTVSKALKDHPAVSRSSREKVKAMARKHHYMPNANVQGIQSGRSQCIGVAINTFADPYAGRVLSGAQEVLHDQGYDLIIIPWDLMVGRHEGLFDRFACRRTDGLLLFPASSIPDEKTRAQLKSLDGPVVQIDQSWPGETFGYVGSDNTSGGREAVSLLRKCGCKRIGVIGYSDISSGRERLDGAIRELQGGGESVSPSLLLDLHSDKPDAPENQKALCDYLRQPSRPDGVFCFNDRIAALVIKIAAEAGISVPEELSVIGFGDLPISHLTHPPLTTFDQRPEEIGRTAAKMLVEGISQNDTEPLRHAEIGFSLIMRGSTSVIK